MSTIPFGEYAPDIADLNVDVSTVAKNVIPGANFYSPLKTLSSVSDALTGSCTGGVTLKSTDGTNYVYAGSATKLENITGTTVTDYSKAGSYTDNSEKWSFIKWGNNVIGSKMGDIPQILALGGTTFADLDATAPHARTMAVVRDFIVLGNTYDGTDGNVPNRVWWSAFNDETGWTPGTDQSDRQDLQGDGGAVQKIGGGEYGIIIQERACWRMSYVGTPLIFQLDEILKLGTPAGGSVVQQGSDIYFLSQDGFYAIRDGQAAEPIGNNKIDNYFWEDVAGDYVSEVVGSVADDEGIIVWAYPSVDSTLDRLIIYNFKIGRWSTAEVTVQTLIQGASSAYTLEDLDSFGTLETLGISLDSSVWQGGSLQLTAFDSSNKMSFFSGVDMVGVVETGSIGGDRLSTLSSVRPLIDGTCTLIAKTRDRLQDSETSTASQSVDSSGKADFRTHARYHKIQLTTTGQFTKAQGVEVETFSRGNR